MRILKKIRHAVTAFITQGDGIMMHSFKRPFLTLLFSMALAAFLPLLLNNLFYIRFRDTILLQQKALTEEALRLSVQQIDGTLLELTTLSMRLDDELQDVSIPDQSGLDSSRRMELFDLSSRLRQELKSGSEYLSAIYLYSALSETAVGSGGVYTSGYLYRNFYQEEGVSRQDMEELHATRAYAQLVALSGGCMAFIRTIRQDSSGAPELQLVFLLKSSFYTTLIDNGNVENALFLLVRGDQILAVSNKTGVALSEEQTAAIAVSGDDGDLQLGEETALLYTLRSSIGGYQVKAAVPYTHLLETSRELQTSYLLLLAASVGLGAVLSVFLSRRNVMPLNELIRYIRKNYGQDGSGSRGLEQIKEAVDSLLDQRRTAQLRLQEYETEIGRSRLLETLRGNRQEGGPPPIPPECRYAVAYFSSQDPPDALCRRIVRSRKALPPECFFRCVVLDGAVIEIVGMASPDFTEKRMESFLTAQIELLDRWDGPAVTAAFSAVHQGADELERACCESSMTAAFSQTRPDAVLTAFSGCEFKASCFLRDWHHLDKQLLFAKLIAEGRLSEAAQLLNALFPAEFLEEYFPESDITFLHLSSLKYQFLHDLDNLDALDNEAWGRMMQDILYCKTHRQLYQLMERLLAELSQSQAPAADRLEAGRVDQIRQYIDLHYADPLLSVSSVAEAFGMSANSLSQLFCRKAEGGVLDYIHQVRMEKAVEMLQNSQNLSIQEIASRTGYTSILTFNRKFKAAYGRTPSEYRKGFAEPSRTASHS